MSSEDCQVRIWVSGRVQGVSFRAYTREQARRLGASGWVKNLSDGRVHVLAQGSREVLERLIEWCHRGSPFAGVTQVEVEWEAPQEVLADFQITF